MRKACAATLNNLPPPRGVYLAFNFGARPHSPAAKGENDCSASEGAPQIGIKRTEGPRRKNAACVRPNSSGLRVTKIQAHPPLARSGVARGARRRGFGKWVSIVSVRWRHFDSFRPQAKGTKWADAHTDQMGVARGGLAPNSAASRYGFRAHPRGHRSWSSNSIGR